MYFKFIVYILWMVVGVGQRREWIAKRAENGLVHEYPSTDACSPTMDDGARWNYTYFENLPKSQSTPRLPLRSIAGKLDM